MCACVLIVEQNAMLALEYAQHAFVLEQGRVVLSGSAQPLETIQLSCLRISNT